MPHFEAVPKLEREESDVSKVRRAAEKGFFDYAERGGADGAWQRLTTTQEIPKFDRVAALFELLRDTVPEKLFRSMTGGQYEYNRGILPINPSKYELQVEKVGGGWECTVYKLESLDPSLPSLVIKIDQLTTQEPDVLLDRAKKIRSEWEEKKEWYRDVPSFVPDEFHFIAQGPRGGRNALFTIQQYFGTKETIRDVFRGIERAELVELLQRDEHLRQAFITFATVTLGRAESHDEMVDTLGDRNVALVDMPEGKQLLLLDPHGVAHPRASKQGERRARLARDLEYLSSLVDQLEGDDMKQAA